MQSLPFRENSPNEIVRFPFPFVSPILNNEYIKAGDGERSPSAGFSLFDNLTSAFGPWGAQHSRFELDLAKKQKIAPVTHVFSYG
jgi:hypothetical protein